jgi:hypothetical protein
VLASGNLDTAIERLVAAWRETHAPRIADLLDAVTARLAPRSLAIAGLEDQAQREWLAVAFAERLEDLPALLDTMIVGPTRVETELWDDPCLAAMRSAERVWALELRDDPRVARALVAMLDDPPFLAPREPRNGIEEFWEEVRTALARIGDTRAAAPFEDFSAVVVTLTGEADSYARENCYTHKPVGAYLEHYLGETVRELRATNVLTLDADEIALCNKIQEMS